MASTSTSPTFDPHQNGAPPSPDAAPLLDDKGRETAKRIVLLTAFLDILGFGIVIPQLGIYAAQFGAAAWQVGLLASTYSLMAFLFTPFWGRLSDRIGRRPVLVYSIFGTAVGYVIFAFAGSLPLLFLSRFVDGVTGGNISVAQAYLSDITPPEQRAKNYGIFGAIFGVGFAIGPMIGWGLSHLPVVGGVNLGGNFGIGALTALLGFFNWYLALKRLPETLSPAIRRENAARDARSGASAYAPFTPHSYSRALSIPGLNIIVAASFLITVAFATLQGTFTLFLIKEFVRPQVQATIRENPTAAIERARGHLVSPKASLPVVSGEGGEGGVAPQAPENAARGGEIQNTGYSKAMGGDYNPSQVVGVPAPRDLPYRRVEQLLVQPQAARDAGIIFFVIGMTALVIQGGLIAPIKKRLGEKKMIVLGTLIMIVGLALVPFPARAHHLFWAEFPVMMLLAAGNSIATPVLTSLASQLAPEAERGELLGVFQAMGSLGRIIGPVAGGLAFERFSSGAPYWLGAFVMVFAFIAALQLRVPKTAQPQTAKR